MAAAFAESGLLEQFRARQAETADEAGAPDEAVTASDETEAAGEASPADEEDAATRGPVA